MDNLNNVVIDLYESAQYFSISEFNKYALGELNKSIQFDSAVVVDLAVTPSKEFLIQSLTFHGTPVERFQDRNIVIGPEKIDKNGSLETRDLALKTAYMRRGRSVVADIEKTFIDKSILKYCKKYEAAHTLTFVSGQNSSGIISTISFGRASKKHEFLRHHSHIADFLLPHILQARKINRNLKSDFSMASDKSSTLLANFDGSLHFVDDKAIELFQLEWKQWTPPLLPPALIDSLKRSKEKVFIGVSINVKASLQGNMICLVVSSKQNRETRLSNAEYRVAKLAAEGFQYKEIAKQLGVSPATVRNQLHSIYGKLGVSNKVALVNALAS